MTSSVVSLPASYWADAVFEGSVVHAPNGTGEWNRFAGRPMIAHTVANVLASRARPVLVVTGSTILLLQPAIARWQERRGLSVHRVVIALTGAAVALYNGYFGAGSGILLIALLMLTTEPVLHRANSLKNVIIAVADVLPAIVFALSGTVAWWAVWPLGIGALAGGLVGPTVARRTRPQILRPLVAACGYVLAVWLVVNR